MFKRYYYLIFAPDNRRSMQSSWNIQNSNLINLPIDNGERNKVPSAILFLLIVEQNAILRVGLELDLDADLDVGLQSVHAHIALAVEGGDLVVAPIDLLVAVEARVVLAALTGVGGAREVDARRRHVAGEGETRAELLRRCHWRVVCCNYRIFS